MSQKKSTKAQAPNGTPDPQTPPDQAPETTPPEAPPEQPSPEQPSAEPEAAPAEPVVATLEDQRAAARKQMAILNQTRKVCVDRLNELQSEIKILDDQLTTLAPLAAEPPDPHQNQKAIMQYIQTNNDVRMERHLQRHRILQGLKLEDALPTKGSKLDEAMARKRGHGMKRPEYPKQTVGAGSK